MAANKALYMYISFQYRM